MALLLIKITKRADKDEQKIYRYIAEEFGEIYAQNFRHKLIETFYKLAKYPLIGRVAKNDKNIRVLILNNKNKLVYKVMENEVIIIRLLNMKTNLPSKY